jgi:hypothetical protein
MYGYNLGLAKARVSESVPAAPANVVLPSLVGNGAMGSVVTCSPGAWSGSPSPTFTFNFKLDTVSVQSGASNTYTPLIGDDTKTLTCTVTATNTEGSANADTSNSLVIGTAPSNTVAPVISGTNTFGSTLTTTNGTFTGTAPLTYTYQWLRGGSPITGETASTYVIGASDSLAAITCEVKATNTYGFDSEVSNTITVQDFAPINTVAPTVSPSGTQSTGTLITANDGTWTGVAPITFEYKWTRDGIAISGATASTYTIQLADDGTTIRVEVKGTNAYGVSAFIASSNSVSAVNTVAPTNSVAPVISGTAVVGQTLTSTTGTWSGIPTPTYSYQWKRGATNIGTNANTYILVAADAGQSITCVVTATNAGGSANATSNALSVLNTLLDVNSGGIANYSLRLLRGAYINSPSVRLRRSSDNAEVNVYFDSNYQTSLSSNINSRTSGTTVSSWIGSNSAFVTTWYDQSISATNLVQATPANQPTLISAGVLQTENSEATLIFNATHFFQVNPLWSNTLSIYTILKFNNVVTLQVPYRDNAGGDGTAVVGYNSPNLPFYRIRSTALNISASLGTEFGTTRKLSTLSANSSNLGEAFVNNVSRGSRTVTGSLGTTLYVGVNGATPSGGLMGNMQTFNIFSNTNVSAINTTLNQIYNVY